MTNDTIQGMGAVDARPGRGAPGRGDPRSPWRAPAGRAARLAAGLVAWICAWPVAAAADPVLATIGYGGGANRNLPVTVATSATESAIVFTTTAGDNPVVQFTCDQAWVWLAVPGGGSATASLPVAAGQTLTLQLDGGAGVTTQYVQRASVNGNLKVLRVR